MRQIKFRVWRYCHSEKKFKFYYLDNLKIIVNGGADIAFQANDQEYFDESVQSLTTEESIEQFTGLLDKNGKDVYEGDVLCVHLPKMKRYEFGKVIYSKEYFTYLVKFEAGKDYYSDYLCDLQNNQMEFEVTGNIHEKL